MTKFILPQDCKNCPNKSKIFSYLSDSELKVFQKNCIIIRFKKGEIIVKQGTPATHALYVAQGITKFYIEGKNKNIIVKLIPQGNFIGLNSIFSDIQYYNFSVAAIENANICMLPKEIFLEQAMKNHAFLREITKEISNCTNLVLDKIISISEKTARGRVIDTLLYFAEKIYKSNDFILPITRKEFAELCTISTENAVRILSDLKNDGLIEINGKNIKIIKPKLLKKLLLL